MTSRLATEEHKSIAHMVIVFRKVKVHDHLACTGLGSSEGFMYIEMNTRYQWRHWEQD